LASQLTGWQIDILTEAEESERRQEQFRKRTELFMNALDVDETLAQLLASENFSAVEDLAFVVPEELAEIQGIGEETANELQRRAQDFLERQNAAFDEKRRELGVEDDVMGIEGVTPAMAVAFGEGGVKSVEDVAGCATDDLLGWNETVNGERKHQTGILETFGISADDANAIIMAARVAAGWIEAPPEKVVEEEAVEEPAEEQAE
jgi:transcription termination/antitermination protein NusA